MPANFEKQIDIEGRKTVKSAFCFIQIPHFSCEIVTLAANLKRTK